MFSPLSYIFFHKYLSIYPLLKVPHQVLCYQRKLTSFLFILFIYMYNKTNTQSYTVIFIPMTIQTHVGHCLNILHKESPGRSFDVRVPAGPTCLTVSVPGSHPSGGISHVAHHPPYVAYTGSTMLIFRVGSWVISSRILILILICNLFHINKSTALNIYVLFSLIFIRTTTPRGVASHQLPAKYTNFWPF